MPRPVRRDGLRKREAPVQRRPEQQVQPGERQLSLGPHASAADHPQRGHVGRRRVPWRRTIGRGIAQDSCASGPGGIVQQRRLADARLAANDQRTAVPGTGVREEPIDGRSLRSPPMHCRPPVL
jgi:hypothetical protein